MKSVETKLAELDNVINTIRQNFNSLQEQRYSLLKLYQDECEHSIENCRITKPETYTKQFIVCIKCGYMEKDYDYIKFRKIRYSNELATLDYNVAYKYVK